MAQHVAWELFCCLIEDVVKRDIVERMHPFVGIFSRTELQGDFCLPFMQREKPAFKELSSTKCTMRSIRSVMENRTA